ncbi:hypothetical protein, partial [Salmonella enterica]|uniref:hypothetical protein n=1 Tax=Salmonella enterica TaxID=28901 RepID=UPI0020C4BB81
VHGVVGQVFATHVDGEAAKFARHLCLQLKPSRIVRLVVQLAAAVHAAREVKVPEFQGRLVAERE